MTWWKNLLHILPWYRQHPQLTELDAALDANTAARQKVSAERAQFCQTLAEQKDRTEQMIDKIRERAKDGRSPNATLVSIAHALKSMEPH